MRVRAGARAGARVRVVRHQDRRRRARRRRALWAGGELLVTVGVVLMLLVVHQLWWTNREARRGAERQVEALERQWAEDGIGHGGGSGSPSAGTAASTPAPAAGKAPSRPQGSYASRHITTPHRSQAYAILVVPRLDLRVPVAEGVNKRDVLDKGYVGHYPGTAQPGQAGNFALAGHRNTHGEPFRDLPLLRRGDTVEVETRSATYTYRVDRILPQTSPRDSGVIRPVPRSLTRPSYGYSEPGHYITLTTCTPDFTSRYRMAVWGRLVSGEPRA